MYQSYQCAACGETNETFIESEGGEKQQFVEDCRVCCRPMVITARWNPVSERYDIDVYQEDIG